MLGLTSSYPMRVYIVHGGLFRVHKYTHEGEFIQSVKGETLYLVPSEGAFYFSNIFQINRFATRTYWHLFPAVRRFLCNDVSERGKREWNFCFV